MEVFMKKVPTQNRIRQFHKRRTVRLSTEDEQQIKLQAECAGMSVAEFMRRRALGKKIVPHTELVIVYELRRMGGLLKNNFETLRAAHASLHVIELQERVLSKIHQTIEVIAKNYDY